MNLCWLALRKPPPPPLDKAESATTTVIVCPNGRSEPGCRTSVLSPSSQLNPPVTSNPPSAVTERAASVLILSIGWLKVIGNRRRRRNLLAIRLEIDDNRQRGGKGERVGFGQRAVRPHR